MERRTKFVAVVIGNFLVGVFFLVAALLVFSGAVHVAGWGEGTLAQRVVVGLIAIVLGGAGFAAAGVGLMEGRAGHRPAEGSGARVENGYGAAGFGVGAPEGRHDGGGTHPGVGEF